jgi:hypothetical protein
MKATRVHFLALVVLQACGASSAEKHKGPVDEPSRHAPFRPISTDGVRPAAAGAIVSVTVRCRGGDACPLADGDLFLDIHVENRLTTDIEFPLAFIRKTGPSIRLVHERTGAETQLRTHLADLDLRQELTVVPPGGSVRFAWVIHESELAQLGSPIDVTAEVVVFGELRVSGKTERFRAVATLRIRPE